MAFLGQSARPLQRLVETCGVCACLTSAFFSELGHVAPLFHGNHMQLGGIMLCDAYGQLQGVEGMIGAVVGEQPFGGEGLSGTGPKAGGPRYLHRFATERTLSIDTTAAGGNATLLSLQEEF